MISRMWMSVDAGMWTGYCAAISFLFSWRIAFLQAKQRKSFRTFISVSRPPHPGHLKSARFDQFMRPII